MSVGGKVPSKHKWIKITQVYRVSYKKIEKAAINTNKQEINRRFRSTVHVNKAPNPLCHFLPTHCFLRNTLQRHQRTHHFPHGLPQLLLTNANTLTLLMWQSAEGASLSELVKHGYHRYLTVLPLTLVTLVQSVRTGKAQSVNMIKYQSAWLDRACSLPSEWNLTEDDGRLFTVHGEQLGRRNAAFFLGGFM